MKERVADIRFVGKVVARALAFIGGVTLALFGVSTCQAQYAGLGKLAVFGGGGAVLSRGQSQGATQFGGSFDLAVPNKYCGWLFEGGYLAPTSDFHAGSGFFSANYMVSWMTDKKGRFVPFATVGYTRLFSTGNAVNFGGGLDYGLNGWSAIRFEARDYYAPTAHGWGQGHDVAFRVGWVLYLPDD